MPDVDVLQGVLYRRPAEAVISGMPVVEFDLMYQAVAAGEWGAVAPDGSVPRA